jgi:hypothetical protein
MKRIFVTLLAICLGANVCFAQTQDTLRLNFQIGNLRNEGLFLREDCEGLKVKFVLYHATSIGAISLPVDSLTKLYDSDPMAYQEFVHTNGLHEKRTSERRHLYMTALIDFYNANRDAVVVLKDCFILDSLQKTAVLDMVNAIRVDKYENEDDFFAEESPFIHNFPDYYTMMSNDICHTVYDPKGRYKKLYSDLIKLLDIHYPPGLMRSENGRIVITPSPTKKARERR